MSPTLRSGSAPASSVSACPRPRAHLGLVHAQHRREIRVALPALEQELEHCLLVRRERHVGSLGIRIRSGAGDVASRGGGEVRCATVAGLADLALRRPWALLAGNLALLAVAVVVAAGAPDRLAVGSLAVDGQKQGGSEPDLIVATKGRRPVHRVRTGRAAGDLRTAQLGFRRRFGSPWSGVVATGDRPRSRSRSPRVTSADHQRTVERVKREIDPGPLRVAYGGQVGGPDRGSPRPLRRPMEARARGRTGGAGPARGRAGTGSRSHPVLCAATAIAGALAGLRIAGGVADTLAARNRPRCRAGARRSASRLPAC